MATKPKEDTPAPLTEERVSELINRAIEGAASAQAVQFRELLASLPAAPRPPIVDITPEEKQYLLDTLFSAPMGDLVPGESVLFTPEMTLEVTQAEHAQMPTYASAGASALDLYAPLDFERSFVNNEVTIDTGISVAVPEGFALLLFSRSGHGFHCGTRLANCVGVIDSDYRGTIKVKLVNDGRGQNLEVRPGDRIAQCVLVPAPRLKMNWVDSLPSTARGEAGIGSTGN